MTMENRAPERILEPDLDKMSETQRIQYKLAHQIPLSEQESQFYAEKLQEERLDDHMTRRGKY